MKVDSALLRASAENGCLPFSFGSKPLPKRGFIGSDPNGGFWGFELLKPPKNGLEGLVCFEADHARMPPVWSLKLAMLKTWSFSVLVAFCDELPFSLCG